MRLEWLLVAASAAVDYGIRVSYSAQSALTKNDLAQAILPCRLTAIITVAPPSDSKCSHKRATLWCAIYAAAIAASSPYCRMTASSSPPIGPSWSELLRSRAKMCCVATLQHLAAKSLTEPVVDLFKAVET